MTRGMLTQAIQTISEKHGMGEITTTELRLIAYIQYVMCNEQKIDIQKVNGEERKVLAKWRRNGHIEGGASGLAITKNFWDYMCEILFEGYVKGGAKDEVKEFYKILEGAIPDAKK